MPPRGSRPSERVSFYDAIGRRATMAVPGRTTISYDANRLTTITQGSNVVTFDYDEPTGGRS
jgi:hypothetical protein